MGLFSDMKTFECRQGHSGCSSHVLFVKIICGLDDGLMLKKLNFDPKNDYKVLYLIIVQKRWYMNLQGILK